MRIRLLVGFILAAPLGAIGGGCSAAPTPYPTTDSFCQAKAAAICKIGSVCQFDANSCQTYQVSQCNLSAQKAMSAGRSYNQNNVQACIDALNAAYGSNSSSISASDIASYTATCDKVFGATAGHHAACTFDADCSNGGDVCAGAPGSTSKTCVTPTPKLLGDACADPGDVCPDSAYCAPQQGTSVCVSAASSGQSCSAAVPCAGGLHCVNGGCQALAGLTQTCTTTADCSQTPTPLYCDPFTNVLSPAPVCVGALTFARLSVDCLGIDGQGTNGMAPMDAGGSGGGDAGGSGGGDAGGSSGGGDAATE
jgi:hypothetical protein